MGQDRMSEAYKKQLKEHLAWVKAERAGGREPADRIHRGPLVKDRAREMEGL